MLNNIKMVMNNTSQQLLIPHLFPMPHCPCCPWTTRVKIQVNNHVQVYCYCIDKLRGNQTLYNLHESHSLILMQTMLMLFRQKFLTSANTVINRLFPVCFFFSILNIQLFASILPLLLCTYFLLKQKMIFATDTTK